MRIIDFRLPSFIVVAFLAICFRIDLAFAQEDPSTLDEAQPPENPSDGDNADEATSQDSGAANTAGEPLQPPAETASQEATTTPDTVPPSTGAGTQDSSGTPQATGAQHTDTPAPEAGTQLQDEKQTKKGKNALEKSSPAAGRNALGLSAGLSSGFGLSYRRYLTNVIALRVEGGVIATSSNAFYSLGVTVQEDFLRTYYYRIYGLQAFGLNKGGSDANLLLAPGAGAGFEYNFKGMRRGLSTRLELVLTPLVQVGGGVPVFTFLPQTGLFFVF